MLCDVQVPGWVFAVHQEEPPQLSQLAGWATAGCRWAGRCQRAMEEHLQQHCWQSQGRCRLVEPKIQRSYCSLILFQGPAKSLTLSPLTVSFQFQKSPATLCHLMVKTVRAWSVVPWLQRSSWKVCSNVCVYWHALINEEIQQCM